MPSSSLAPFSAVEEPPHPVSPAPNLMQQGNLLWREGSSLGSVSSSLLPAEVERERGFDAQRGGELTYRIFFSFLLLYNYSKTRTYRMKEYHESVLSTSEQHN